MLLTVNEGLVLSFQHSVFLNKNINVRLLLISHLFKLSDVISLLYPYFFKVFDTPISASQLASEHFDVGLCRGRDKSFSLTLDV